MHLRSLLKSTAARFAAIFILIFAVTSTVVGVVTYLWVTDEFRDRQLSYIDDMRGTLLTIYRRDGLAGLTAVVQSKVSVAEEAGLIYLLTDQNGLFLAGNIRPIPRFEGTRKFDWSSLALTGPWPSDETPTSISASWTSLPNGYLLLGDDDGDIVEARKVLLAGLAVAVGSMLVIAGATGTVLGIRAQRRIEAIAEALRAAAKGTPKLRVLRQESGDDLDLIGKHVNSTLEQLERVIDSLRQVSADIAHDLKTPLGKIQRRLEAAQGADSSIADYRTSVTSALAEMDGLVRTFDALLSIAQLEAGFKRRRFRDLDIADLLNTLTEAYAPVAEQHEQFLTFNRQDGCNHVTGDRELLNQLFANLVENAIRHCPPGARIDVALQRDESQSALAVIVSDDGPGIPDQEKTKVFRRLYRLEKSRTTPGNGLGLSLVAAIAGLHDGHVKLEDNRPGLRVRVTLPVAGTVRELSGALASG